MAKINCQTGATNLIALSGNFRKSATRLNARHGKFRKGATSLIALHGKFLKRTTNLNTRPGNYHAGATSLNARPGNFNSAKKTFNAGHGKVKVPILFPPEAVGTLYIKKMPVKDPSGKGYASNLIKHAELGNIFSTICRMFRLNVKVNPATKFIFYFP
jgi:hypothetical protein